jgi:hypothetical protein
LGPMPTPLANSVVKAVVRVVVGDKFWRGQPCQLGWHPPTALTLALSL